MSLIFETIEEPRERYIGIQCDRCKRISIKEEDPVEHQEYACFSGIGGFGSLFGDGVDYDIDLCQHCFNEVLGKWVRVKE